jgi:YVTN family beta-propeller protein
LRNFQSALQEVVPGDPTVSRLLNHPLALEAGGDPFHSGGSQFQSQNDPDWLVLAEWVRGVADPGRTSRLALIYVTNSAGDTVDVIDPTSNKVVQVIQGIELPHGIAFSPDGKRVYISNESESIVDVVDRESAKILKKIPLSGHPNNLTINTDTPAGIGNVACAAVLAFRHNDGSNQLGDLHPGAYSDWTGYVSVNPASTVPVNPALVLNPDHWQPLTYDDGATAPMPSEPQRSEASLR